MDPPRILAQPRSVTATPDEAVSFSVSAEGPELQYQWQFLRPGPGEEWKNSSQDDSRSPTLQLDAKGYRNGYLYRCVISSPGGSVCTEPAELHVTESVPPKILSQSHSRAGFEGDFAVFQVEAAGAELSYQWFSRPGSEGEWLEHSGTDGRSSAITLVAASSRSSWQYFCRVSNRYGSVDSEPISLRVTSIAPPLLLAEPADHTVGVGSTAVCSAPALGFNLSYQWQYLVGGSGVWSDCSSEDACTPSLSVEARDYRSGYHYRCLVSNGSGEIISRAAMLTVAANAAPVITRQPRDQQARIGDTAVFSVEAAGQALNYLWQFDTGDGVWRNCSSEGSDSARLAVEAKDYRSGYRYRCLVFNDGGSVSSEDAVLSVSEYPVPQITTQPVSVTARSGSVTRFTVAAAGFGLSYQWYTRSDEWSDWVVCSGSGTQLPVLLVEAGNELDGSQYRCRVSNAGGYVYSAPATLRVSGSARPTILFQPQDASAIVGQNVSFHVVATGSGLSYQWYYRADRNAAWSVSHAEGCQSDTLTVQVAEHRNGYQYRCIVSNSSGRRYSDAATLSVRVPVKPYITEEPADAVVSVGDAVSFTVTAVGSDLSYQWYALAPGSLEWGLCSGAKEATLSLTANAGLDGYRYCCRISNDGGYIDSRVATLWVRGG